MSASDLIPAWPAPSGHSSNLENPEGVGYRFVGLAVGLLTLTVVVVVLRLYTQIVIIRRLGLDDYTMLLAAILSIVMTSIGFSQLKNGLGLHIWDVPLSSFSPYFLRGELTLEALYFLATSAAKISILVFYLRIFTGRKFKIMAWSLIIVCVQYGISTALATVFGCRPISAAWQSTLEEYICINKLALYYANTGLGIFIDFSTFVLPLPQLLRLQLPWKQKIGVAALLTAGTLVCVMSIARITATPGMQGDHDITYNILTTSIWCLGELHMSIIAGSLPVMKPFVRRYFPRLLDLATTRKTSSSCNNIRPNSHIPFHRLKSSSTLQQPDKIVGDRGYFMPRRNTAHHRTTSEGDRPAEEIQDVVEEQVISDEIECQHQQIKIRDG